MKAILKLILAFSVACSLGANSNEITLEFPDSSDTISVDFPDSSVFEIIDSIAEEFSLEIEIPLELKKYRTSIKLRSITWEQILEVTLEPFDYAYLETEDSIKIMTKAEFESLSLVVLEWQFIFISAEEFTSYHEPLPIDQKLEEGITKKGNTLIIECHPSKVGHWKDLLKRSDTPYGLPKYPKVYWPDTIPKSVEATERSFIDGPGLFETRVYIVEWVDPKLLRGRILSYLDHESEVVSIDKRSRSLIITAKGNKMNMIMNVCDYLDERHWYTPNQKPEPGEVVNASQPAGLSENHLHD